MLRTTTVNVDACKTLPILGFLVLEQGSLGTEAPDLTIDRLLLCACSEMRVNGLDMLYLASSLPRAAPSFHLQTALARVGISVGQISEFGNNCATILDALLFFVSAYRIGSCGLLACVDTFGSDYHVETRGSRWQDGAAAIMIGEGWVNLKIKSYVTSNDTKYAGMAEFRGRRLLIHRNAAFEQEDVRNEIAVAECALSASRVSWGEIDGYIIVNRSGERTKRLQAAIPISEDKIFYSREQSGHRGGSDIIQNLGKAVAAHESGKSRIRLLLIGNGLGYTWSAMQIDVEFAH